jgi:hypothetical protein
MTTEPADNSNTQNVVLRDETASNAPDVYITVQKRPRYSIVIDGTTHYAHNMNGVVDIMKEQDRPISIGDAFKSIHMKPHSRYRLRERLNGAIIHKIARY